MKGHMISNVKKYSKSQLYGILYNQMLMLIKHMHGLYSQQIYLIRLVVVHVLKLGTN